MYATVRSSHPEDREQLELLERTHFPPAQGQRHSGFVFADKEIAALILDESVGTPLRTLVSIAEVEGAIEGFAVAVPFSLPGGAGIDPHHMLLQYVAVNESMRGNGIGRELINHLEQRIVPHRQNVLVAHIPTSEVGFYEKLGWDVMAPGAGYAWLPYNGVLRADLPDGHLGFDHMAVKVLRPRAIRTSFAFSSLTGAPTADACVVLETFLSEGRIDWADLDDDTARLIAMNRMFRSKG